jgi:hypothetical protein
MSRTDVLFYAASIRLYPRKRQPTSPEVTVEEWGLDREFSKFLETEGVPEEAR